jgi:hypothetical protein
MTSDLVMTRKDIAMVSALAAGIMLVVFLSPVLRNAYYCQSDPHGTLMTSQSLIQYGTIRLDAFRYHDLMLPEKQFLYATGATDTPPPDPILDPYLWQINHHRGHFYHYFPVGTALLSAPFAAFTLHVTGTDLTVSRNNWSLQRFLAALTVSLIAVLSYILARLFLKKTESLFITVLFITGTSLASTCGTALWSFNFQIVFILLALMLLYQIIENGNETSLKALVMGICVFTAYLCRPTTLVFAAACLIPMLIKRKFIETIVFTGAFAVCSGLFVLFSFSEYGMIVPPYYDFTRAAQTESFIDALKGVLISPSRGLFVFSPFLAAVLSAGLLSLRRKPVWIVFCLSWLTAHLISLIYGTAHWWGGHAFGPRLMTDIMPAWMLLAFVALSALKHKIRLYLYGFMLLTGVFSIAVHTVQGLYNPATYQWNISPNIDINRHYLNDWRYPQFLATQSMLQKRMELNRTTGFQSEVPAHD